MTFKSPPNPAQFRNMQEWALQFYQYTLSQSPIRGVTSPSPVMLARKLNDEMPRAVEDGVLLYDPVYKTAVMSQDGVWLPIKGYPELTLAYETAYNVAPALISSGGMAVPLNTVLDDSAAWGSLDPTTGYVTLLQGSYYFDATVSACRVSGTSERINAYLALTSDLTTPVGNASMAVIYTNTVTDHARLRGQVDVPEGGETYAIVVDVPTTDYYRLGIDSDLSGLNSRHADVSVQLIGFNA